MKKHLLAISFCLVTILLFVSPVYLHYGYTPEDTIRLAGAHYVDSMNNIALITQLQRSIPPENSNFSGTTLTNYHYFINLILAVIQSLTHVDLFALYFWIAPAFLLSGLIVGVYFLAFNLRQNRLLAILSTLICLLGSNWYYFFSTNPSAAWLDEFSTKLVNYQYLSSLIVMVYILLFIIRWQKLNLKHLIILSLLSGSLLGFKSYSWIILTMAFFVVRHTRVSAIGSLIVGIVLSQILFKSQTFPFRFQPGRLIQSMYESPDRLNIPNWGLALQTYRATGSLPGISKLYILGGFVFLLINIGPRIFGLIIPHSPQSPILKIIKTVAILGLIPPLLLVQSGSGWNVIQFAYYSVFFLGLLIPQALPSRYAIAASTFIFLSLLPGALTRVDQYEHSSSAIFSKDFIEAARFLINKPYGSIVLPKELRSNTIVSAISGKPLYVGDGSVLQSYNIDSSDREELTDNFFENPNFPLSQVSYVFVPKSQFLNNPCSICTQIYSNPEISVYKINHK